MNICVKINFYNHFWSYLFLTLIFDVTNSLKYRITPISYISHVTKIFSFPIQILLFLISFSSLFVWVGSFDLHVVCYHAAQKEEEVKEDIYHHQQL